MTNGPTASLPDWGHGARWNTPQRFAVRDTVAMRTDDGAWLVGTVIGVTYGTSPLYDVLVERTGELLKHLSPDQLLRVPPDSSGNH